MHREAERRGVRIGEDGPYIEGRVRPGIYDGAVRGQGRSIHTDEGTTADRPDPSPEPRIESPPSPLKSLQLNRSHPSASAWLKP